MRVAFLGESQLRQSRATQPPVHADCLCFHNPPNSDMDYGIFNVRTDVNACDCTQGCTDTVRGSALKVDFGRKNPCRTGESNLRRRRAGPMLYQPSYTPTQNTAGKVASTLFSLLHEHFSRGRHSVRDLNGSLPFTFSLSIFL